MKKLIGIGLLLALLGVGVGYFMYNKPHQNMEKAEADMTLESTALFSAFEANEAEANEKYLDKVIKISGTVKEVNTDEEGNISLTLESGNELFGVICQMDNLTKQEKTDFKIGEQVTLKGICTGMLMDVVLVRCVVG
ncbi:MAG: hypothetical protein H6573_19535 [Lewinellaceae bacterium]|nr:hypothetical protein [Phaeodactylibacter sp.]MCB9349679.1 hypothetical protein [Lewinellaceae bacterium]